MVFCGKPSRACGRCRARRLKCDEGTPFCSACLRAGAEECEYRDHLSLRFRDQTKKVIRRSQQQDAKKLPPPSSSSQPVTSVSVTSSATTATAAVIRRISPPPPTVSPCQALTPPTWQMARCYMYANYMSSTSHCGGYLPCLASLTQRSPDSGALQSAITAVGLAALANVRRSGRVMAEARRECNAAISMVGSALGDPVEARRDDVLAAVFMLSMYEVMTCSDSSAIRRWMGHIDGATSLIEMRGEEQLDRPEGLELFRYFRVGICLSGITRQSPISPMLTHLTYKAKSKQDSSPQARTVDNLATVVFRLNDFCADLKRGKFAKPSEVVREALKLDADLVATLMDVPASASYTVVESPPPSPAYYGNVGQRTIWGDNFHVYNSIMGSNTWSNYRSARIFVREVIVEALRAVVAEDENEDESGNKQQHHRALMAESRQIGRQLVDEVCASAPYYLDPSLHSAARQKSTARVSSSSSSSSRSRSNSPPVVIHVDEANGLTTAALCDIEGGHGHGQQHHHPESEPEPEPEPESVETTGGRGEVCTGGAITLLWPLLLAANSGFASAEQREWIVGCLDKIGNGMGIGQAKAMAQVLRDGKRTTAWISTKGDVEEVEEFEDFEFDD